MRRKRVPTQLTSHSITPEMIGRIERSDITSGTVASGQTVEPRRFAIGLEFAERWDSG